MLRPIRTVRNINTDFVALQTQERGGILSFATVSGVVVLQYSAVASGVIPFGIQYNDIEYIDYSRQPPPWRLRELDIPCGIVGVLTDGEVETDWLYISGIICTGMPAYVGPSGTITNDVSLGSKQIGYFTSDLSVSPHLVVYKGLGYSREYMDCVTKLIQFDNNPADMVCVISPGFARIRINQSIMERS